FGNVDSATVEIAGVTASLGEAFKIKVRKGTEYAGNVHLNYSGDAPSGGSAATLLLPCGIEATNGYGLWRKEELGLGTWDNGTWNGSEYVYDEDLPFTLRIKPVVLDER